MVQLKVKQIREHFNDKNNLIVFLIIFIGIMCPLFSGKLEFNFWTNMNDVLTSPVAIICLFIASIINTYKYIRSYASKCMIINRFSSFKEYIAYYFKDVIYMSAYLFLIYLLLGIGGSILFSLNNFTLVNYYFYNVSYAIYLPILIIREFILFIVLNIIIYYVLLLNKKYLVTFLIIFIISLFYFVRDYKVIINNFYNMYLLYPYYFMNIKYQSLSLEIICSIIEIIILYGTSKILYKILCSKKRDLL